MKLNKLTEAMKTGYNGVKTFASKVANKTADYANQVSRYLMTSSGKVAMTGIASALAGIGVMWAVGSFVASATASAAAATTATMVVGGIAAGMLIGSGVGALTCGIAGIGGSIATGALAGTLGLSKLAFGAIAGAGLLAPVGGVFGSYLGTSLAGASALAPVLPIVAGTAVACVAAYLTKKLLEKLAESEDLIEEGYIGA